MDSLLMEESAGETSPPLPSAAELGQKTAEVELSKEVAAHILTGTSTLGAAVMIERGASFAANILAARFAGASVFGAYSVGISTANNISTYAAGGIGATATRFSGKYPYGGSSYVTFARVLGVVSVCSALVAASVLFLGAGPIAHILHQESLTGLLRWASLSAAGMLLLECVRGFFVGQRRLLALALLSLLVGAGMVSLLPAVATSKMPEHMVAAHGSITLAAVLICLALAKPLGLLASGGEEAVRFSAMLREVWGFGFIQLSGLLSANLAGWWITALVARGDSTLIQMGFFAIASQLRNMTGIVPALLTEGSYAVMATPDEANTGMPQRVMALCTFGATLVAYVLAALGIIVVPWALHLMYGPRYGGAVVAASIGMSVAVLQMGNAPPSARVSVVSIRSVAVINTVWALITATSGTLLMMHWSGAAGAMAVFFLAHAVSATLTFWVLARKDRLPSGLVLLFLVTTVSVACLSFLAFIRDRNPSQELWLTLAMAAVLLLTASGLYAMARRYAWLGSLARLQSLAALGRERMTNLVRGPLQKKGGR